MSDRGGPVNQSPNQKFNSRKGVVCYQCGQEGHTKPKSPNNLSTDAYLCSVPRPVHTEQRDVPLHYAAVVLNGLEVRALVDTSKHAVIGLHRFSFRESQKFCFEGPYMLYSWR